MNKAKTKRFISTFLLVCFTLALIMSLSLSAFADDEDPFQHLKKVYKESSKQNQEQAIKTLSPALKLLFLVFFILGIVGFVVIVGVVIWKAIKVGKGNDSFSKKWVGTVAACLAIFILFGGSGWLELFSAGKKLLVEPAKNILTEEVNQSSTTQSQTQQTQTGK